MSFCCAWVAFLAFPLAGQALVFFLFCTRNCSLCKYKTKTKNIKIKQSKTASKRQKVLVHPWACGCLHAYETFFESAQIKKKFSSHRIILFIALLLNNFFYNTHYLSSIILTNNERPKYRIVKRK